MSIKVFSMAILASLLCLSCSETNVDYDSNTGTTSSTGAVKTYDVDIEASTDNPDNQAQTRANMPFKVSEENISGKTVLYPKLNITQQTMPSVVVLYNKTHNKKEVVEANWTVKKEGSDVKFQLNSLSTQSNLANGEWYIMGFMGGGEKKGDDLEVNTETTINVIEKGKEFTTSCPFATTWRRIVKQGSKLKLYNERKKMVFKPQGVFLVLSLENRVGLNTKINRELTLESNAFCSSGSYKFNVDSNVSEDADLASSYWEPNSAKAIARGSAEYKKYNAEHYTTNIKLNYESAKDDGSLRQGQSDLNNYIYFNSYKKSGQAASKTKTNRGFLICLMPVDYKKTSNYGGIVNETLLFGKVDVTDPTRTNYTYDKSVYTTNPNTWKPFMGNRYLLASFSDGLAKGSSYGVTLRIVRPTLPIERLWAYRQADGLAMEKLSRVDAEKVAEGTKSRGNYPNLDSHLYRLPKYSEFTAIFNNPKLQLENNKPLGGVSPFNAGAGYGLSLTTGSHRDFVDLNGKQRKFDNWFCSVHGSNVMYGIMYMKPVDNREAKPTNNYKVAVRVTFPSSQATSGNVKVETYYLGPNYNLSFNVAGYYMCHEEFWKRLNQEDIIVRTFKLDFYWLANKDIIDRDHEPVSLYTKINLDGVAQGLKMDSGGKSYFLPWLKSPAW
ncbi:hypothetical protein [Prevotella sp. C561]|uniref:hypothetical protein n=1 Tax=Prevotella sp. C561 TaxID=563031 RepID=UPI0012F98D9D|nr:hypothetical protein [Prevotella sp. C561]